MIKKVFFSILISIFLLCNLTNVFGYEDTTIYSEDFDMSLLIQNIVTQLHSKSELDYNFRIDFLKNTNKIEYATEIQNKIITYLDGILVTSPSIKMKISNNIIKMNIKKDIDFDVNFVSWLDDFIINIDKYILIKDKIKIFANYLYTNNYKYCEDISKYGKFSSSNVTEIDILTADGVIKTKEGICEGYANLLSVFLDEINIPNIRLRGYTKENILHTWNLVYFCYNGKFDWYCVDLIYALKQDTLDEVISSIEEYSKIVMFDKDIKNELILLKYPKKTIDNKFIDIEKHWAKIEILNLANLGVVKGYTDTVFKPNNNVTEKEVLILLSRIIEKVKYNRDINLLDNSEILLYYKEMLNLEDIDLYNVITREKFSYFLNSIILEMFGNIEFLNIESVKDIDNVNLKYKNSVLNIYNMNLMRGVNSDSFFLPDMLLTRGQITVVLNRLVEGYLGGYYE